MRKRLQTRNAVLTFVTIRALFGIEFVRGYAEHIVALDADAVQHGRFGRCGGTLLLFNAPVFSCFHDGDILPRGKRRTVKQVGQHPRIRAGHLTD